MLNKFLLLIRILKKSSDKWKNDVSRICVHLIELTRTEKYPQVIKTASLSWMLFNSRLMRIGQEFVR